MARARDDSNGLNEVNEAWRHSAAKISSDLARTARDAQEAAEELGDAIRHSAEDVVDTAATRSRQAVGAMNTSVRRHPMTWMAGAVGIGALIGLVLAGGSRSR